MNNAIIEPSLMCLMCDWMEVVTMAWFLVILNAFGILAGFAGHSTVSTVLFGVSFLALFPVWEKLAWEYIMGPLQVEFSTAFHTMNRLANGLVTVFALTGIYVVCVKGLGIQYILVPLFQSVIYSAWKMVTENKPSKIAATVCCFAELVLAFVLLILE